MNRKSLTWLCVIALPLVLVDQLTKSIAIALLEPSNAKPFLGEVLKFYLIRNDSAAFSMGNGQTWLFTLFSSVAALLLLWYGPRVKTSSWAVVAGLLLGGVVGNLIDRVVREPGFPNGHVIDFLQLPFGFPVFNIADMAIVAAMTIVTIRIMRGHRIGQ